MHLRNMPKGHILLPKAKHLSCAMALFPFPLAGNKEAAGFGNLCGQYKESSWSNPDFCLHQEKHRLVEPQGHGLISSSNNNNRLLECGAERRMPSDIRGKKKAKQVKNKSISNCK